MLEREKLREGDYRVTEDGKIALIETTIGVDGGTLKKDTELKTVGNWDSIGKLFLLSMFQKEFGRVLPAETMGGFQTVGDIMNELHE
jgi:acyl carrier protein